MNDKILDRAMKKYRNHGSRYFGKEELPTELANEKKHRGADTDVL